MSRNTLLLRLIGITILAALLLSACNYPGSTPALGTTFPPGTGTAALPPGGVGTTVAQPTPTLLAQPATVTSAPTGLPNTSGSTPTPQPTPGPTTVTEPPCNRAEFVSDVTYPDGTAVPAGTTFVKTWRLKNNGTCTWNSNYYLAFYNGNQMGAPDTVAITNGVVAPGTTVDVSVTLKAPTAPGSVESDWMLATDKNQMFGIGPNANQDFWARITVTSANTGTRISLHKGATSTTISGHVDKNGRADYLVGASANQVMMLQINTVNQPLVLEIKAPDGSTIVKASENRTAWQGILPADGDYLVSIVSTGDAADFNFSVTLPVRVKFKAGTTSASLDGTIAAKDMNTYILKAQAGLTMTVTVTSDANNVFLAIYGYQDGNPYIRYQLGQTTYSFKLPATQDYVVQLVSTADTPESYTVKFTVK